MFANNKGRCNEEACRPPSYSADLVTTVIYNNHWDTDAKNTQMVPFLFCAMAQMASAEEMVGFKHI